MKKLTKLATELVIKYQVILGGLLGIALPVPLFWELFKHGPIGGQSVEVRAGFLGFSLLVMVVWFLCHCLTPDKTALKKKWWK